MTIGERIKFIRHEKKLSRRELSETSGVSEIAIKQYESELREPRIKQLKNIADALNISICDFFEK